MRHCLLLLLFSLGLLPTAWGAAAPPGYEDVARDFNAAFDQKTSQILQLWLIAGGYTNAVPTEHFTTRTFKALQQFQADNGFVPNARLDKTQIDRLIAIVDPKFSEWGFRKIVLSGHEATLWVPIGLGLDEKDNGSGLHYKDRQGRLALDFVSVPDRTIAGVYNGLLADKRRDGSRVNYAAFKDNEDWFVLSSTSTDGSDHYYRYHQDYTAVTGFALEWNNAYGNVNGERIAVIDSAVLGAAFKGAPFIDPPDGPRQEARAPAVAQPTTVPVAPKPTEKPAPAPEAKTYSSGTGFFVTEDGHFVTNAHVVADCLKILVKADDGSINDAERVATDNSNDLALLKLAKKPARVVALRIGGRLGEGVEAFGFPHSDLLASSGNFTLGNITALSGLHDDSRYMQISAPVQAGNSGGPLLDQSGNLLGVVSAKLDAIKVAMASDDLPQNVNFAVKSAMVAAFLDANRVTYKVGAPAAVAMQPADIADQARAMSGFVVCR